MAAMQLVVSVAVFLACQAAGQQAGLLDLLDPGTVVVTGPNTRQYGSAAECPNPCAPVPRARLPCMFDWAGCTRDEGIWPLPDLTRACTDYSRGHLNRFYDPHGCTGRNPDPTRCREWQTFAPGACFPLAIDPLGRSAACCRKPVPGTVLFTTHEGTYYPTYDPIYNPNTGTVQHVSYYPTSGTNNVPIYNPNSNTIIQVPGGSSQTGGTQYVPNGSSQTSGTNNVPIYNPNSNTITQVPGGSSQYMPTGSSGQGASGSSLGGSNGGASGLSDAASSLGGGGGAGGLSETASSLGGAGGGGAGGAGAGAAGAAAGAAGAAAGGLGAGTGLAAGAGVPVAGVGLG